MRRIRSSKPGVSWLQGPGATDLWTWLSDTGEIEEQELTFFGRTVVFRNQNLMTGLSDERGDAYFGKTGLLAFDRLLDRDTLRAAYVILTKIPPAQQDAHVSRLLEMISQALVTEDLLPLIPL